MNVLKCQCRLCHMWYGYSDINIVTELNPWGLTMLGFTCIQIFQLSSEFRNKNYYLKKWHLKKRLHLNISMIAFYTRQPTSGFSCTNCVELRILSVLLNHCNDCRVLIFLQITDGKFNMKSCSCLYPCTRENTTVAHSPDNDRVYDGLLLSLASARGSTWEALEVYNYRMFYSELTPYVFKCDYRQR